MEEKIISKVDEKIRNIIDGDITTTNLDNLYKLTKIKHMAKEDEKMNYGNYDNYSARRPGYDSYGEYNGNYGARGYDRRYRGHDSLDRMYSDYGRYMESRDRYGAGQESEKSFMYMIKSLEDFIKVLEEEADTPAEKQQLRQALQNSMR